MALYLGSNMVDVHGGTNQGGGGSSWTLIHEEDIEVSTSSTTAIIAATLEVDGIYTSDLICVIITDKVGARDGYFYRTISLIENTNSVNGGTGTFSFQYPHVLKKDEEGNWSFGCNANGVYPYQFKSDDSLIIRARYNATSSKTIDSTYAVKIYKLSLPDGSSSPFA